MRRAFLRFWRDFFFHVAAQASQLFVEAAAQFFEFVHKLARRYERRDFGITVEAQAVAVSAVPSRNMEVSLARDFEKGKREDGWVSMGVQLG